jgi:myo-inositol catabolism protein IolC
VNDIYMLAFDHRSSFSRDLLGVDGTPTEAEAERVADLKELVFEGFLDAVADGLEPGKSGLLVDEQYGARVARTARSLGVALAMPVERSGRDEFEFEFGDDFGGHIERFDPTYAKVLVRYNPGGDRDVNRRQCRRLKDLSDWLHARGRRLLFELLVPPTAAQLETVGGSKERFDTALRPDLVLQTIREVQAAGVEPDIWKIEGLDERADCERIAAAARAGGRDHVTCIVLGRGADDERVAHWLAQAAPVEGFSGFAVGRTLWWNELSAYVAGEIGRSEAARRIGLNYRRLVGVYEGARA